MWGGGALGMSVFLDDYNRKTNNGYHLHKDGNLSVLTNTNGGISHISFNIDCVTQVESLVIQLWEQSDAEPIAQLVEQTETDGDEHPVNAPETPPPLLALCAGRRRGNTNQATGHPTTIALGGALGDTPLWDKFLEKTLMEL